MPDTLPFRHTKDSCKHFFFSGFNHVHSNLLHGPAHFTIPDSFVFFLSLYLSCHLSHRSRTSDTLMICRPSVEMPTMNHQNAFSYFHYGREYMLRERFTSSLLSHPLPFFSYLLLPLLLPSSHSFFHAAHSQFSCFLSTLHRVCLL